MYKRTCKRYTPFYNPSTRSASLKYGLKPYRADTTHTPACADGTFSVALWGRGGAPHGRFWRAHSGSLQMYTIGTALAMDRIMATISADHLPRSTHSSDTVSKLSDFVHLCELNSSGSVAAESRAGLCTVEVQ